MDTSWDGLPIHVIDFEGGPRCGIVEFGVVTLVGAKIVAAETALCRPKAAISRKEQATHGIGNDLVASEALFAQHWDLFAGLRQCGPFAAHFASAENAMLKSVFPFSRQAENWARPGSLGTDWGPWIDTGYLYRNYGDNGSSLKLEDLILHWSLQQELDELALRYCPEGRRHYHSALYDALGSALLLLLYCKELRDGTPSVPQLFIESQGSGLKRQEMEQQQLF